MATQASQLVNPGDYVYSENKLCYVEDVQNILGFNQYILVGFDSGRRLFKMRHEIETKETKLLNEEFDKEFEMEDPQQKEEKKKKRKDLQPSQMKIWIL